MATIRKSALRLSISSVLYVFVLTGSWLTLALSQNRFKEPERFSYAIQTLCNNFSCSELIVRTKIGLRSHTMNGCKTPKGSADRVCLLMCGRRCQPRIRRNISHTYRRVQKIATS